MAIGSKTARSFSAIVHAHDRDRGPKATRRERAPEMSDNTAVMATHLDADLEAFRDELRAASDVVVRLYGGLERTRVTPAKSQTEIASLFDAPLPEVPQQVESILKEVERDVFGNSTLYLTPRFFGYINAGGSQVGVL